MIAIDAMGGDNAPLAIVQGALIAARSGIPILLCGRQEELEAILTRCESDWRSLPIHLEPCAQVIAMADDPLWSVRRKSDSSLVRAMQAVVDGRAEAFLSAGNSGAVLFASITVSARIPGIMRPAIGGFLPTRNGSLFCLDLGANSDCTPEHLHQFAIMGDAYIKIMTPIANPRIAILSNGHEPYKGSAIVKKTYDYLQSSKLNFVGNIEARDIFDDRADILVCDGFVGNVMLKAIQGTSKALFTWLKDESIRRSLVSRALLWLNEGLFRAIKKRTDYTAVGGALLLGVNHPVIIAHGSSDARAIANAIIFARNVVQDRRVERFKDVLCQSLSEHKVAVHEAVEQLELH